jgi:glycosyltransferase involved in cell wall biosynthesis
LSRVSLMTARTDGKEPVVSVVVPSRNATATIPALFAALDRQVFSQPWEVVVVDDCSTDGTAEIAEGWGARVVRLESQSGPAAARNAGLAAARAPLVAFTDADCEPTPKWLAELVVALGDADIATGPVLPTPGVSRGPFARTLHVTSESPLYETANLAVRSEIAERVGGFEPFAPRADGVRTGLRPSVEDGHFGEDAVFAWRARRLGARVAFAEGALVHHAVFSRGARGYIAERWRLRFFPALVREIPELRSRLHLRFFLAEHTALFDLAAASAAVGVASRRRWPLLGAVPYLYRRLSWRQAWQRSVARRNLALVVGDVVGFAALVRGSIAARRLLL